MLLIVLVVGMILIIRKLLHHVCRITENLIQETVTVIHVQEIILIRRYKKCVDEDVDVLVDVIDVAMFVADSAFNEMY